ncbi:10688_t:CDS:1 [Funneliformis geosporum]|uniref:10688_t:CDS:1 n=1 Tax=Funneliformis geosporum TaxID=1117311 RepID=A0A9W4T878_9GLOM|nr:10688_t:CDS:1 [Funneliformis geosporum]
MYIMTFNQAYSELLAELSPSIKNEAWVHLTSRKRNPISKKEASEINPIIESFLKHEAIRYQKRLMRQKRTQSWPECSTLLLFKEVSTIYVADNGTQTDDNT